MENGVQGPVSDDQPPEVGWVRVGQEWRWRPRNKAILLLEAAKGL